MDTVFLEIDRALSGIASRIDLRSRITPLNGPREERLFFESLSKGGRYEPTYVYPERKVSSCGEELRRIKARLSGAEGMGRLLMEKAGMVALELELSESDDENLGRVSERLWGMVDDELLDDARRVLVTAREEGFVFPEETVAPEEMKAAMEEALRSVGINWEVELSGRIVPKMTVSASERAIHVNSRIRYSPAEVERLKVHEVLVHVIRGENGYLQPLRIFVEGTARYGQTEEGLALFAEERAGMWRTDTRQLKLYAGRALATRLALDRGFRDTYDGLVPYFPREIAYRLTERCKRGLRDTSRPGGVYNGYHYLAGFKKIKEYSRRGGDMCILYAGKVALEDVPLLKELLSRGEIELPGRVPDMILRGGDGNEVS